MSLYMPRSGHLFVPRSGHLLVPQAGQVYVPRAKHSNGAVPRSGHDKLPRSQNSVLGTFFQDLGIRYITPNTVFRY